MEFNFDLERITPENTGTIDIGGTGAFVLPSGTTVERPTGAAGMLRFNTDLSVNELYNTVTSNWEAISTSSSSSPTGGGTDKVFYENSLIVTTNYTLTTGKNAMSTGPITINSGITVTIPTGQRWVVL